MKPRRVQWLLYCKSDMRTIQKEIYYFPRIIKLMKTLGKKGQKINQDHGFRIEGIQASVGAHASGFRLRIFK